MDHDRKKELLSCSVPIVLLFISGKRKTLILRDFLGGIRCFFEAKRILRLGIHEILAQQLQSMEKDLMIPWETYSIVPP